MKLRDGYNYPKPAKKLKVFDTHGYNREDHYYWLREKENPEVIDYLKQENILSNKFFADHKNTINELFEELKFRTAEDEDSAPVTKGPYTYWSRYRKGLEHPQFVRRLNKPDSPEEMVLDENEIAKSFEFMECTSPHMSSKQDWVAYGVDTQGRRFYTIYFKNLTTGQIADAKIENVSGNFAWAQDNETIFYSKQDPATLRTYQVYRFHLPTQKNELVYEEKDSEFGVGVSKSFTEKFIFLTVGHHQTDEVRYLPADKPLAQFKVLRPRIKGVSDSLVDGGDCFYLLTNANAPNHKLLKVPYESQSESDWLEVIAHRDDTYIADIDNLKGFLVITERKDGLNKIRVIEEKSFQSRYLNFEDPVYIARSAVGGDFIQEKFRIVYESPRVPSKVIDISLKDFSQELVKQKTVPNYNPEDYKAERVWITARDGKKVPASMVMKKDFKADGESPLFQYAYGSYGYATNAGFMISALSLVDRGFVFCIAHVRGGNDLGRAWYDDGRMKNKMNTFTDFIDVTEGLIAKGYAKKGHVYARGGSAGGLLMGAIANIRPDLYNGLIAEVPFVDVLSTMLDDTIPLTTFEYEEWGNPNIKEQYDWMAQYSPYDNVKVQDYPHILIRTGLHDSQVQYWEPAKWIAKLRDYNTSDSLILMAVNMDAGHGGVTGRFKQLKETAESLSFAVVLEQQSQ